MPNNPPKAEGGDQHALIKKLVTVVGIVGQTLGCFCVLSFLFIYKLRFCPHLRAAPKFL
jgi:hypothetical protein